MHSLHENNDSPIQQDHPHMGDPFNISASSTFDLTKYLTEEEPKPQPQFEQINFNERKPRAGVKKIDLKAQKYIVNNDNDDSNDSEEELDHSEIQNTPVLEACDLYSLLEQFEATEMPDFPSVFMEDNANLNVSNGHTIIKKEKIDSDALFQQDSICESNITKIETVEEKIKVDIEKIKPEPNIFIKREVKTEQVAVEEVNGELKI